MFRLIWSCRVRVYGAGNAERTGNRSEKIASHDGLTPELCSFRVVLFTTQCEQQREGLSAEQLYSCCENCEVCRDLRALSQIVKVTSSVSTRCAVAVSRALRKRRP